MKKAVYERCKELVLSRYESMEDLNADLMACGVWRMAQGEPRPTTYQMALQLIQSGAFDCYCQQALQSLRYIYQDGWDASRYLKKNGDFRWRGGECYAWTIYKNTLATCINRMMEEEEENAY